MKKKIVAGILTDGDARRGIKHYSKNDQIEKFMTSKPFFVSELTVASKALAVMNNKKITSLLVTSEKDYKNPKKGKVLKGIIHIHSLLQYGLK